MILLYFLTLCPLWPCDIYITFLINKSNSNATAGNKLSDKEVAGDEEDEEEEEGEEDDDEDEVGQSCLQPSLLFLL